MGRRIFSHSAICFLILLAVAASASGAQNDQNDQIERTAHLSLMLDAHAKASVYLTFDFDPADSVPLAQSLSQTLGCTLQDVKIENGEVDEEDEEGEKGFRTLTSRCAFQEHDRLVEGFCQDSG